MKTPSYLIPDPHDQDSLTFIRTIYCYFGLRPICLWTDPGARFYGYRRVPLLGGGVVEASYDVKPHQLASFAAAAQKRYDVRGVVPVRESTVSMCAELCRHFDFRWNSPATLQRFRDKHALKEWVRRVDPGVRVPACRLIRSVDEVWASALPARFVIKPNDGYGNRDVGVFEPADRAAVTAHLLRRPGSDWVLEEYIGGTEFHVDGQVRRGGEVTVLGVMEYSREEVNGSATVYRGERQCRTDHPLFATLCDYARRLLRATGLERCPFHLEVKVDAQGPCVVDLGARLASEGGGDQLSRMHPYRPDVFAVAAHDYLFDGDFAMQPLDWRHYDDELLVLVYGVSKETGIIQRLEGVDAVEAMPEFVNWSVKPAVGDRLVPTRTLSESPYIVELRHRGTHEDSDRLIARVRSTVQWNRRTAASSWVSAHATRLLRRAPPRLSWLAHQLDQVGYT